MANQEVPSMQFFMEMKKKFPELSEEVIHDFINRYPDDIKKCQEYLQQESDRFLYATSQNIEGNVHPSLRIPLVNKTCKPATNQGVYASGPSSVLNGMAANNLLGKNILQGNHNSEESPINQEVISAPVISSANNPFFPYANYPSHHVPPKYNYPVWSSHFTQDYAHNIARPRMSEPTSSGESETTNFPIRSPGNNTGGIPPTHCTTRLEFNPSRPYLNDPPTSGKHRTSINVEVNPGDHQTCEISSYPLNSGASTCQGYDSHLKISLSPTTASFCATRIQKPGMYQQPRQASIVQWPPSHTSSPSSYVEHFSSYKPNYGFISPGRNFQQNPWLNVIQQPTDYAAGISRKSHRSPPTEIGITSENDKGLSYTQGLLQNQKACLRMLHDEVIKEQQKQIRLEQEIKTLEEKLKELRQSNSFPNMELINKLKDEVRKLQVECQCLSFDIDQFNSGEVPLGRTDDDFYKNIPTGQPGPIPPYKPAEEKGSFGVRNPHPNDSSAEDDDDRNKWKCTKCTFENHPALNKCEMCEMSRSDPPYAEE